MKKVLLSTLALFTIVQSNAEELYDKKFREVDNRYYSVAMDMMSQEYANSYGRYAKNYYKLHEILKTIPDEKERQHIKEVFDKYGLKKLPRPIISKEGVSFEINGHKLLVTPDGFLKGHFKLDNTKVALYDESFNLENSVKVMDHYLIKRDFTYKDILKILVPNANAETKIDEHKVVTALIVEIFLKESFGDVYNNGKFIDALRVEGADKGEVQREIVDKYLRMDAHWRPRLVHNINQVYMQAKSALDSCRAFQDMIENGVNGANFDQYVKSLSKDEVHASVHATSFLNKTRKTDRFLNLWLYTFDWEKREQDDPKNQQNKAFVDSLMRKYLLQNFEGDKENLTCRGTLAKHSNQIVHANLEVLATANSVINKRYKLQKGDEDNACRYVEELTKCLVDVDQKDKRKVLEEISRRAGKDLYFYQNLEEKDKTLPGWSETRD
ncbi:hypothetical protein M899_2168 [Bacteriovorax sp. BSW11_IV]|uniref:hypothetical protein n=1 Tax=Bacteriovorax sp. BSW11_IV TaxID=1353529 RepID=UPI00038A0724|nr:hypothetical protein [Bacteriovorax sp. BSW11_IV]EQC47763.1 hypothetical protein M899_2168 [Bacteriovorax sp. BSW11_IV]